MLFDFTGRGHFQNYNFLNKKDSIVFLRAVWDDFSKIVNICTKKRKETNVAEK